MRFFLIILSALLFLFPLISGCEKELVLSKKDEKIKEKKEPSKKPVKIAGLDNLLPSLDISDRPQRRGSYFDFLSLEYRNIFQWECPVKSVDENGLPFCKKAEVYLKNNDEFNAMGITSKANPDCFAKLMKVLFNGKKTATGYLVSTAGEDIIKRCYYRKYFTPFKRLPKCLRPLAFDIGVLAGQHRGAKFLQKSVGTKPDGDIGPKTIRSALGTRAQLHTLEKVFIQYLKKTKFKGKSLWHGWEREDGTVFTGYKNGWTNRINWVIDSSEKYCVN